MTSEFNQWWDADDLTAENSFTKDTPAFWAWEGWVAGQRAEREAIIRRCEEYGAWNTTAQDIADEIRMRGES